MVEIHTGIVSLQQRGVKVRVTGHRPQSLPGPKRVRNEQPIIGDIAVPAGTVNGNIERSSVGDVIGWVGIELPEPIHVGEVSIVGPCNRLVRVPCLNIVLKRVTQLPIDAVAREGNVEPYVGLNAVLVWDPVFVVVVYVVGICENRGCHDS